MTRCIHCGAQIVQVTLTGITVWAHESRTSLYPASLCTGGKRAEPEEESEP